MSYNDYNQPPRPPQKPPFGSTFFDSLRSMNLRREPDRWVGGVASALAYRIGWDPILVRGLILLFGIFTLGTLLLLYGVAWALIPDRMTNRIHLEDILRGNFDIAHVGIILMVLLGGSSLTPFRIEIRPDQQRIGASWVPSLMNLAVLVLVIVVIVILVHRSKNKQPGKPSGPGPNPYAPNGDPYYPGGPSGGPQPSNPTQPYDPYSSAPYGSDDQPSPYEAKDFSNDGGQPPANSPGNSPQDPSSGSATFPHEASASSSAAEYQAPKAAWNSDTESMTESRDSRTFDNVRSDDGPDSPISEGGAGTPYGSESRYEPVGQGPAPYGHSYGYNQQPFTQPAQGYPPQGHPGQWQPAQAQAPRTTKQPVMQGGPGLATFLGITGFLFVVFAVLWGLWMTGVFIEPVYMFTTTVGIAYVVTGLVLGIRALMGKRGTWLTGLAVVVTVFLPIFLGITGSAVL